MNDVVGRPAGKIKGIKRRHIWTAISFCVAIFITVLSLYYSFQYKTFSSDIEEVDFTFKYPRWSWDEPSVSQSDGKYTVNIQGPFDISVSVYLRSTSQSLMDVYTTVEGCIKYYSSYQNFDVLSNNSLTQGEYSGPLAVVPYDVADESGGNKIEYIPSRAFIWVFLYDGKIYEIIISGSRAAQDKMSQEIVDFLESFEVLD